MLNRGQKHSFRHSQGLSSPAPLPQAEQAPRVSEQPRELDLDKRPGHVSGESQHTWPLPTPNAGEMYLTKIAPAGDSEQKAPGLVSKDLS